MQGDRLINDARDFLTWQHGWVVLLVTLAALYIGYMAGYYDGYHAGAIIYVGGT